MNAKLCRISFVLAVILSLVLLTTGCSHKHDYGDWNIKKEATCIEEGAMVRICNDCGYENTEKISSPGKHQYVEKKSTTASCVGNGSKTFICSLCNGTYIETIAAKTFTSAEICNDLQDSVAEIITYDKSGNKISSGSGFVYSSDGRIVTTYRVIENAYTAAVVISGSSYPVEHVLSYDKDIDIAMLKISASDLAAVTLCKRNHPADESIYALGSDRGLITTFTEGTITQSSQTIRNVTYIQHSAPFSEELPGGPLVNKYGEVIGINTQPLPDSESTGLAIHIFELNKLNYNYSMTMPELYRKEAQVFAKLRDHIIENGTQEGPEGLYYLAGNTFYLYDYQVEGYTLASFYPTYNIVTLSAVLPDTFVAFEIYYNLSGTYYWMYMDSNDQSMSGLLEAATFDSRSLLEYSNTTLSSATDRAYVRAFASVVVDCICQMIPIDFPNLDITPKDLGFLLY